MIVVSTSLVQMCYSAREERGRERGREGGREGERGDSGGDYDNTLMPHSIMSKFESHSPINEMLLLLIHFSGHSIKIKNSPHKYFLP